LLFHFGGFARQFLHFTFPKKEMASDKFRGMQPTPIAHTTSQTASFDLIRLTKSKEHVDVCPNTIRAYASQGLDLYRVGKAVFFSKTELAEFIRAKSMAQRTAI
jgi:hypothetical protein